MNQTTITSAPSDAEQEPLQHRSHRFIDESGDPVFYGRDGVNLIDSGGASKVFMLGMVHIKQPLAKARDDITSFTQQVVADPFFNEVPSIKKRLQRSNTLSLHAKDDPPELRYEFFKLLRDEIDFSLEVVVGRKQETRFVNEHHLQPDEFYADLLSHLLKDKAKERRLVLNIADRGSSTRMHNLDRALLKAQQRYWERRPNSEYKADVVFNVLQYNDEPLLTVADYSLWAVQRIFVRGETRFYNMIANKVSVVVDLYDTNSRGKSNYYTRKRPLTKDNWLT